MTALNLIERGSMYYLKHFTEMQGNILRFHIQPSDTYNHIYARGSKLIPTHAHTHIQYELTCKS